VQLPTDHVFAGLQRNEPIIVSPDRALEIGKAAEHLVCADLILSGYRAFLSDQGLPYDVVIDNGNKLLRVQVKSCGSVSNVNAQGRVERLAYNFSIRRRGKDGKSDRLSDKDCDIIALVALDIRVIAYLPIAACKMTAQIPPPGYIPSTKTNGGGWWRSIDQFPIAEAISGKLDFYDQSQREPHTHCKHGHELSGDNLRLTAKGHRRCRACEYRESINSFKRRRAREDLNVVA